MSEPAERYSFTRLETFRECPRKYHLHYIESREPAFETIEAILGQVVHACLAWLYRTRQLGVTPSLMDLGSRYVSAWTAAYGPRVKVVKRGETVSEYSVAGREMLAQHYQTMFKEDCRETLATERPFTIRLSGRHLFTGVVDRLARNRDGAITVIDYKTTRHPPRALDDEAALQLRAYGVYALLAHGADSARLEYQYLRTGTTLRDVLTRHDANVVIRCLEGRIESIAAARSWMPMPSSLCAWCGFSPFCSAASAASASDVPPKERDSCPRCGGRLELRKGRFGSFMGCMNFPGCRYSREP